jgi:AraC-like DNA-binding protein
MVSVSPAIDVLDDCNCADVREVSKEDARRLDLVRRAEEIMWLHVEDALDPASIARELSCSVRKLLYYFKRTYGLGPMGYFKLQRLYAVRDALLHDRSGRTIADVAAEYGFWHMGHFGTAYRRLFGLTPSQTRGGRPVSVRPVRRQRLAAAEPSGKLRLPATALGRETRSLHHLTSTGVLHRAGSFC